MIKTCINGVYQDGYPEYLMGLGRRKTLQSDPHDHWARPVLLRFKCQCWEVFFLVLLGLKKWNKSEEFNWGLKTSSGKIVFTHVYSIHQGELFWCKKQQLFLANLRWFPSFVPSNPAAWDAPNMLAEWVENNVLTYLPRKAVAEVSKDKEPIGRECAEFNWFECQLMSDSNELRVKWCGCHMLSSDLRFKWFWLSIDLRFKWFGCQLIWDSNDLVVNRCVLQMILVVCWFELQVMWLSIDLRFKWFGCQLIWGSSDLVVNRFEIQMSWLSIDLRFKWFGCQMIWGSSDLVVNWCVIQMILSNEAFLRDFLQKRSFEDQKRSFSARLPSKLKLWSSKTKQFCETSFKNEAWKIKNEAFLRDFLQNWSFEAQNEAFVRDFLQKWSFEDRKRSNFARLRSKLKR